MDPRPRPSRQLIRHASAALAAAVAILVQLPASAQPAHLDPADLPRGPDPTVAHLVRDTIRDGSLRVPATTRGEHDSLWVVRGGYVVRDYDVGPRQLVRVVLIRPTGERRELARSRWWIEVATSPSGRIVAIQRPSGSAGLRSQLTVLHANSGRVVAHREFGTVTLAAVGERRVLLGQRDRVPAAATLWWNHPQDTIRRVYHQAAVRADLGQDKVVFEDPARGEFCTRTATLSRPDRTLWRSCLSVPHQWSPDGRHALATHSYFDAAGTDRWWLLDGRTGQGEPRVSGRLDWHAVWEDDRHFLTLALSDTGRAAVIRCDLDAGCERASRLWDVRVPHDPTIYYASPPVVLADRVS